jgi:hypothetical protein
MTNNPRNPLPGEQPESPQGPGGGMGGMDPSQQQTPGQPTPGQPTPGQPTPGQPGQRVSGQQQSDLGPATPASGTARSTGSSATGATPAGATPVSASQQQPRGQETTSRTVQRSGQTTRADEQPRRSNNGKKIALAGILGLAAVAGIVTGFAASNNSSAPVAAVHRTVPAVRHSPVARAPSSSSYKVLTTFNETGARTSAPFAVTNPSAAHWTYSCAHGAHAFSASMATTSGGNRLPIASTSGTSGTGTAILRPSSTGSKYQITANSACPYHIRIYGT